MAIWAPGHIRTYLKWIGILYGLDAVVGLTQGRGFLDGSIVTKGMGAPDFSATNILVNLPHIVLAAIAVVFGFRKSPSLARSAA